MFNKANNKYFKYEIKKLNDSLFKYKLEVWGAKSGDSTGLGCSNRSNQPFVGGCLGVFARGILNLAKEETLYIYIGEEGSPSN